MLTRAHAIARYDRGRLCPDRLTRHKHARYLAHAERMLEIYRQGAGRTRQELHRALHDLLAGESNCPVRRIEAFAKLLDDVSTYAGADGLRAWELRRAVFRLAGTRHPLVAAADRQFEHTEAEVKAGIAAEMGRPWPQIDGALYADVMAYHRLDEFAGYADAQALLSRYNVAQAQAALFDAVSMTVWASQDFKVILRYAKLAGLMHTIRRTGEGSYEFRFDGPASVLRRTRRYGVALAKFLPALLPCAGWRMQAVIRTRGGRSVSFDLSPADRLTSHLPPPEEFDSQVEVNFARAWGPGQRAGWSLIREGEVLFQGQKVFVPDFVFRRDDGRTVLLEIVGFWTPEYLEAKQRTLRQFAGHNILLAVAKGVAGRMGALPANSIRFKTRLRVKDVLEQLNSTK